MAGLLHRTAQPPTLAAFRPWEGSAGAGRVRPAGAKIRMRRLMAVVLILLFSFSIRNFFKYFVFGG